MSKLHFEGKTRVSQRFGFNGLLYARNIKTGIWRAAIDEYIWAPADNAVELEAAYRVWIDTASNVERKAAKLLTPPPPSSGPYSWSHPRGTSGLGCAGGCSAGTAAGFRG